MTTISRKKTLAQKEGALTADSCTNAGRSFAGSYPDHRITRGLTRARKERQNTEVNVRQDLSPNLQQIVQWLAVKSSFTSRDDTQRCVASSMLSALFNRQSVQCVSELRRADCIEFCELKYCMGNRKVINPDRMLS